MRMRMKMKMRTKPIWWTVVVWYGKYHVLHVQGLSDFDATIQAELAVCEKFDQPSYVQGPQGIYVYKGKI